MKKLLIFFVIFASVAIVSCNKSDNKTPKPTAAVENIPGKDVYTKYCRLCHGSKGDLGLSGSANLTISALSLVEVKYVLVNGRNAMPAWEKQLSEQEIDEVATYVLSLRN